MTRIALALVTVVIAGAYVWVGLADPWDFRTYFFAAKAFKAGLNPYSLSALSGVAQRTIELPFVYPPLTLLLFIPLAALPLATASVIWLVFKLVCLCLLLWTWSRHFLRGMDTSMLIVATLLGFNLSVLWDLRTGNVAIIEATVLWIALLCYLQGKVYLTTFLISIASVFKLLPILLLGIVLFTQRSLRARLALIGSGILVFLVTVLAPFRLAPEWISAVGTSIGERPPPEVNASALAITEWFVGAFELPSATGAGLAIGLYILYCALILTVSIRPLLRVHANGPTLEHVLAVVLIWLLIAPRLMVYSYALAIVPVLYVIRSILPRGPLRVLFVALLVTEGVVRLIPGPAPGGLAPLSFAVLVGSWIAWVRARTRTSRAAQPHTATP